MAQTVLQQCAKAGRSDKRRCRDRTFALRSVTAGRLLAGMELVDPEEVCLIISKRKSGDIQK